MLAASSAAAAQSPGCRFPDAAARREGAGPQLASRGKGEGAGGELAQLAAAQASRSAMSSSSSSSFFLAEGTT